MRENLREQLTSCNTISDFLLFWLSNSAILNRKNRFDSYYRTYLRSFTPRMQKFYQSQSLEVAERISQKKKPKLLDIGCGCGTETLWFAKLGAECTGIDLDNSMIEVALERKTIMENLGEEKIACHFQRMSVFELDPRKKFDIIWMEQAFHHIEPREKLLPLLFTLLNDDGVLIISESNAWNPLIQLFLLKIRGVKTISYAEICGELVPCNGIERIITPFSLGKSLRRHGFIVSSLRYFRLFPSNKIFDKVAFLEPRWPRTLFPAFTHYNIVAEKHSLKGEKP